MQSEQLERFRVELSSSVEAARLEREALGRLAEQVAAAAHSICWFTWIAEFTPKDLKPENLAAYDKELHVRLAEIVAARVVLSMINSEAHNTVSSHINKLYVLDAAVSEAKKNYSQDPDACCLRVAKHYKSAHDLEEETLGVMLEAAHVLNKASRVTAGSEAAKSI